MTFWIQFFNQPKLWLLAIIMVIIVGVIIDLTPNWLMVDTDTETFFGPQQLQMSYSEIKAEGGTMEISDEDTNWLVDISTNYLCLSGVTGKIFLDEMTIGKVDFRYNTVAAIILSLVLLLGVSLVTRRSVSVIFVLGPLFVCWLIIMIIVVRHLASATDILDGSMQMRAMPMLGSWLVFNVIISLLMYVLIRYVLAGKELIRGIDESGPLDFSKLKKAGVHTFHTALDGLDKSGAHLQAIMTPSSPMPPVTQTPNVNSVTSDVVTPSGQLIGSPVGDSAQACHQCGSRRFVGRGLEKTCRLCRSIIGRCVPKEEFGRCPNCEAPQLRGAKFCYLCGQMLAE